MKQGSDTNLEKVCRLQHDSQLVHTTEVVRLKLYISFNKTLWLSESASTTAPIMKE
jgi:hypothetical protein